MYVLVFFLALFPLACSDDDEPDEGAPSDGSPEETGSSCESAASCFEGLEIQGDALCLDRVRGGYCTHTCTGDADCCAVAAECETGIHQVCSPFESADGMMCFLSCEREDVDASARDYDDDSAYCQGEVNPDFICRSSGGGSNNRKICVPGDCGVGASCAVDADCANGLDCISDLPSGYCGARDCVDNTDCPNDSRCVVHGGVAFCAKTCSTPSDCSFCRYGGELECSVDAEFMDPSGSSTVCLPILD